MDQKTKTAGNDRDVLDPIQLEQLEQNFRAWAAQAKGASRRLSRSRILSLFLVIRYTGAKLSEALGLMPSRDINTVQNMIIFRATGNSSLLREVEISQQLAREMEALLSCAREEPDRFFLIDPAYVRRKFYERAEACGFHKQQGGPEMLRRARVVELIRNNLPMPAIQRLLGNASTHLAASADAGFVHADLGELTRVYMERESGGKTSARNSFVGKICALERDGVQTLVEMRTLDGGSLLTIITNTSARRLDLRCGRMVSAEVKAPWLVLERADRPGSGSADNIREGVITGLTKAGINTECMVRLPDGTEMCSILSTRGFARLGLEQGDRVRVLFSAFAVILHSD